MTILNYKVLLLFVLQNFYEKLHVSHIYKYYFFDVKNVDGFAMFSYLVSFK